MSSLTETLARTRLTILAGAALLALAAAMLLAAQPAEAQTLTGTLEAGKTNRCVLEQFNNDTTWCDFTVPGDGEIMVSAPNPARAISHVQSTPYPSGRMVRFRTPDFATDGTNSARLGKSTWTIRNTPTSGQPVDYTVELEVYAWNTVPGGKTKGVTTDTTAPANTAPAGVPGPVSTGTLVADQTVRCALHQSGSVARRACTVTVPGSGTIAVTGPIPSSASDIVSDTPSASGRTVAFGAATYQSSDLNTGKGTWTITNTNSGTVTTYKVEVTVYTVYNYPGSPPAGARLGFLTPALPAPTGVTAAPVAGETAVTLGWTAPEGTVTKYQYQAKKGAGTYGAWADISGTTGSSTSGKVTGLEGGASYVFKVRAYNATGGEGMASTETTAVAVPPAAPTSPTATRVEGELAVTLGWTAPSGTITKYQYQAKKGAGTYGAWADISGTTGSSTSGKVTGLEGGASYVFKLRAMSGNTAGAESAETSSVTVVPAAPTGLAAAAAAGEAAVTLTWTRPTGTLTKQQYAVKKGSAAFGAWVDIPSSTTLQTYKVTTGLEGGASYTFKLRAHNASGAGVESAEAPVALSPAAPTGVTAEAGEGKVTLSWTAPSGTLTKYQYVSKKGSEAFGTTWMDIDGTDGDSTSGTVTGLEAASYQFKVRAVSAGGNGAESTATTAVNVKPGAPTGVLVKSVGFGEVTLGWTKPAGTLTKHQYQQKEGTGSYGSWKDMGEDSAELEEYTVTGLTGGVAYRFKLRAVSAGGEGAASGETISVRPNFAAPTGVSAEGGAAQAALSWTAPSGTPTKYQYVSKRGDGVFGTTWADIPGADGTSTSGTVTGLRSGSYQFKVRAVSDAVSGAGSEATDAVDVTAAPAPAKLAGVTAAGGAGQATLGWTDPSNANILRYEYRQKSGEGSYGTWTTMTGVGASGTSYVVTGLAKGSYTYQVRAVTEGGGGPASDEAAASVTPVAPVAPTGLKAAAAPGGVGTVTLSWTAPANAALADVAKYQYRSSSGGSWTDIADSASLTMYAVTGLQPGTSYDFSLRAVNSAGAAGPASASAPVSTTPSPPSAPRGLSAEPGEGTAALRWTDPSNATITRYEYRWKRDGGAYSSWTALPGSGASTTTATLSGLTPGMYVFQLRAVNAGGNGAASAETPSAQVRLGAPGAPSGVDATVGGSAALLRWSAPAGAVTGYEYRQQRDGGSWSAWMRMPGSGMATREHTVRGLANGTYAFQVRALNGGGAGTASAPTPTVTVRTSGAAPGTTPTPPADPAKRATLKLGLRGDSDGIVRPGQNVELTAMVSGNASQERLATAVALTIQTLNLYAKQGSSSSVLVGSQVGERYTFPGGSTATLNQLLAGGSYALEISVPSGTPPGSYVVTAKAKDGARDIAVAPLTLTVSTTNVEVAAVRLGPSSPRQALSGDTDADGDGYADDRSTRERTAIAAGAATELTLEVLNASGKASEANAVSSISIFTTGGSLSSPAMTAMRGACRTGGSTTCELDYSALRASGEVLPSKIRVLLTAPSTPGAAVVSATVVAGGEAHTGGPVTVTFTGPARSLSLSEAPGTVLGHDLRAKADVEDNVPASGKLTNPDTGAAARDELKFTVAAADGSGNAVETPELTVSVQAKQVEGLATGSLVSTNAYRAHQYGSGKASLLLDIDAARGSALALKPGEYTLTVSAGSLQAERTFIVVGGASSLELALTPAEATVAGEAVVAAAALQDADGNPVADGTSVTFMVSSSGSATVAVLDVTEAATKGGEASVSLTVVGPGRAVVRAKTASAAGGSLLKSAVLVSRVGAEADGGGDPLACLSELSGFAVWTCAGGSSASALFELLSARGASAVHLWNGSAWIRYSVVDGTMVPGSRDFTVGESDIIYISN